MQLRQARPSTLLILLVLLGASRIVYGLQCRFDLAPYTYDLCPLIFASNSLKPTSSGNSRQIQIQQNRMTPPTVTRQDYYLDLGGEGLLRDGTLPVAEQCPAGTWICFRISNTRPNHPSEPRRILQIVPVAGNIPASDTINGLGDRIAAATSINATARLGSRTMGDFPSLEITLHGGTYLSNPQRAVLIFLCDKSAQEPSIPAPDAFSNDSESFSGMFAPKPYTHLFTWRTKHACPIAQDEPEQDGNKDGKHGDDGSGNDHTVHPETPLSDRPLTPRKKVAGVVIGCLAILSLVSYGIYALRHGRPYPSPTPSRMDHTTTRFPFVLPPILPRFLRSKKHGRIRSWYEPLTTEEYEIRDEEPSDEVVTDFQRQVLLDGSDTKRGYGSVK